MKEPDIFDDIIAVIRRHGETTGGLISLNPETRQHFLAAASRQDTHELPDATPQPRTPTASAAPTVHIAPMASLANCTIDELRDRVAACKQCRLCEARTQTVFGSGNPHAELMFIGEGPGQDEDRQGLPFVGAAGQLLTKMISAMQFDREADVYIANIVKCRPPGNRNPEPDEAGACLPYLRRQIELIKPQIIVLLGAVPLKYILGKTSITRERGRWDEFMGIKVMPTYHPAYLLRYEAGKKEAWSDLQQVMKVFGKVHRKN